MKNSQRRVVTAITATILLSGVGATVLAESASAVGASPTTASTQVYQAAGDVVQVPVHIPVDLCGNAVGQIGALNPAHGNHCTN